ncbi:MAG: hypothetical protein KDC53_24735, partial [Saprospiraceae bacterium]|nr:hypothetical protein [Saprospiraceae bacterium]
RALDHFQNNDFRAVGVSPFLMNTEVYFAPYADFANLDLTASDTTDRKYQALRTFQTVLNELDESQVQFDLNRLEYVYRNSSLSNKDTLYINAINHLYDSSLGKDNKALCAAQMASVLFQMGKREESHRWCQIVIELYADTNSASACLQLRQQLEQPELGLQIEQVNLPGQVLLGKLNYRNLGQLYFTVVSWNKEEEDDLRILSNEEQLSAILGKKVIHKGIIKVPSNSDFQSHSTEFKIPALDLGSYLILVSSGPDYVWEKDYIVGNDFLVSRLSYSTFSYEGSSNILCFDRQSGNPLSGVKVSWYQNIYDRQRKMQTPQKITETFSNEMGVAPPPDQRGSFIAALELGEDRLKLQDQYINTFGWNSQKEASVDVMYFLDRSIYRPGQTVQFKGLLLHRDQEGVPSIKPNTDLMVKLYDANGKELSSQKLISNAYGSFYGSFILPESSLAGQFSIGTDLASTRIYFRMESYKRPTFEIELAAKSKTPVLNEDVLVSGRVTSYAGAPLGNINAVYHVVRKVRYPFYSPYARISWQSYPGREIASGTLKTQPDGTFQLIFKAMADDITSLRYAPVCDFEVSVTAIDISGESHQKDLMVSIGSTPFGIQYVGPPVVNLQRDKRLSFKAVNAQGQVVEASGHVMLRLLEDKPWSRQRYWDIPDQLILSQGQYLDSLKWYAAPIDMDTALQEVVSESSLNLSLQRGALTVDLSQVDVLAGRYQLLTTLHDSIGREVETTFEIQVIDPSQEYVPSDELLSVFTSGDTVAVGDTLQIDVAAPIAGEVLYTIERQSGLSPAQWLPIDGWEVLKVPVSRDDQGGIFLHFQIAYQNRILQKSISIAVPWVNKNVSIVTETLRKITEPGSKETVTVKLINDNGNNQNELLVSMFDASLDALYPHQWN